jgi:hypothetical protein
MFSTITYGGERNIYQTDIATYVIAECGKYRIYLQPEVCRSDAVIGPSAYAFTCRKEASASVARRIHCAIDWKHHKCALPYGIDRLHWTRLFFEAHLSKNSFYV